MCVCVCQVYWVGKKVNRAIRKQEHVETSVIEEKEKSKQAWDLRQNTACNAIGFFSLSFQMQDDAPFATPL